MFGRVGWATAFRCPTFQLPMINRQRLNPKSVTLSKPEGVGQACPDYRAKGTIN